MNVNSERPLMVFKREYNGRVYYSLGISKKEMNGTYTNGYMPCEFKKGVNVNDKTRIYLKNAFLTFYLKDKVTVPYIKILEYETVEETIQNSKDPFEEFGEQVDIDDNLLED